MILLVLMFIAGFCVGVIVMLKYGDFKGFFIKNLKFGLYRKI